MYSLFQKIWYRYSQFWVIMTTRVGYFKRFERTFSKKIDRSAPLVYAGNHQSAFVDALIVSCGSPKQANFLLRSDVFKPGLVTKLLELYNMMPIYRQRDGIDALDKNDAIFEKCHKMLKDEELLIIFPEGNCMLKYNLRPLKKGVTRIVMQAAEKFDYKLLTQIVPVGINYGHHTRFQTDLLVNYGDPINVSDYYEEYKKNQAETMTKMLRDLSERMKGTMIHITNMKIYDGLVVLKDFFIPQNQSLFGIKGSSLKSNFDAMKKAITLFEDKARGDASFEKAFGELGVDLQKKLNMLSIDPEVAMTPNSLFGMFIRKWYLILFFPYFIFAVLSNMPLALVFRKIVKGVKDDQWHHSLRAAGGMFLYPTYYTIQALIAYFLISNAALWGLYVFALIPSGLFLMQYGRTGRRFFQHVKLMFSGKLKAQVKEIRSLRDRLYSFVDQVV